MKLFRSTPIFIKGILIAGIMSACQNENDSAVAPQAPTSPSDQNARTALAAGTLIKDGDVSLSYFSQGQNLWKETFAAPNTDTEFIYTPQLITAKRRVNGVITEEKYILNSSGRCVQSGTLKIYIYVYDTDGQLTLWYNKDMPNERAVFSYPSNAAGWKKPLSMVSFYNASNTKTKEVKFNYGGGSEVISDEYPLNPAVLPASKYLRIFGHFGSNLVQSITEDIYVNGQKTSTSYLHSYTLDYAGKVKNVKVKNINGNVISSTDRSYSKPVFNM